MKTTTVFVSNGCIESGESRKLIARLADEGFEVRNSPIGNTDKRWHNWYEVGLKNELAASDVFVMYVDKCWDGSSWMLVEADEAYRLYQSGKLKRFYFIHQDKTVHKSAGALPYLINELPEDLEALVEYLKQESDWRPNEA